MTSSLPMSAIEFQARWASNTRTERSAAQEHFLNLCQLVGAQTPSQVDPTGSSYTFEKCVETPAGRVGFADVWRRRYFAWEYKRDKKDLIEAYDQLQKYRESLENPPLLVTSDIRRIEIHTNFTNTVKKRHDVELEHITEPTHLDTLRRVFFDPGSFKPGMSVERVTEDAAARFAELAVTLEARTGSPQRVAHFLVQVLFCLFAEDVGLLDEGVFTDLVNLSVRRPDQFSRQASELFRTMREGGIFALHEVDRFNGGLFAHIDVIELTKPELQRLTNIASLDWSNVEPAIFGTLFERSLDPSKRKELGAHYTPRADIERVIKPVIIDPLRRRWVQVRGKALEIKIKWQEAASRSAATRHEQAFQRVLTDFQRELSEIQILDPACGSGNFLYVTLVELEKLEKEVSQFGALNGLSYMLPMVRPTQLHGLEINPFARELAQVVVWIGYLQWMRDNGFHPDRNPVLHPLETISLQNALVDRSATGKPIEAQWPKVTYIIGNPPFLGAKQMRAHIGDDATNALHSVYGNRLPPFSDLVCYFFEKARAEIEHGNARAAGLLATNSIRGGTNRTVLDRIKASGDIFMAWDDEPWVQNGAAVRISLIGFDDGTEEERFLDSIPVSSITSALTSDIDLSRAKHLDENAGLCYLGVQFSGPFDMSLQQAQVMLALPVNPNGRPNSDVLRPVANGIDITRRWRDRWVVDFGVDRPEIDAALYEAPFQYLQSHVQPMRASSRSQVRDQRWWLPIWSRLEMRSKIGQQHRYLATPTVSKHRLFTWLSTGVLPSHSLVVFARQDDYFFGVLHSRAHELWSLRMGTWLGKGNDPRYTPTTCFETFPLPWPSGQEPWRDARLHAIANAARELDEKRRAWLDPPDASGAELKKRTLTNLYNERPALLVHAHAALDHAVWAAYGWNDDDPSTVKDDVILTRLLALNQQRASGIWMSPDSDDPVTTWLPPFGREDSPVDQG